MPPAAAILARGPWPADAVDARWCDDHYEPPPERAAAADEAIVALHDVDLYERFRADGEVSVQTYSTDSSTTGAEFDATVFGAGFEYEETDAELLNAYYLDDRGFQPWARCDGTGGTA